MDICQSISEFFEYIFWWILFILFSPLVFIVFGCFIFWKFAIIEPLAKLCISKTLQRLDPFDSILATDSFWERPLATIGLLVLVDGKVDINEFRQHFISTILEAKTADRKLIYRKLQRIPKEFGGYFFWEVCTDFKIDDHINEINCLETISSESDKDIDDKILKELCKAQIASPFPIQKPLWDITLFPNYSKNHGGSAIFLRFHHSIADGLTICKLIDRLTGITTNHASPRKRAKKLNKSALVSHCFEKVKFIFRTPYVIGHFYLDNIFHSDIFTERKTTKDFLLSWTSVPLGQLRSIRQRTKTHFSALGISLLSGSFIGQVINNESTRKDNKPSHVRVMVPLPWPNHPSHKMTNHWTMGIVKSSLNKDPLERLKFTETNFCSMLDSGSPQWCRLIGPKLLTLLPCSILKLVVNSNRVGNGIIFTSVPGSSEKESISLFGNLRIENMIPIIGPQYSQTGVVCVMYTYNGKANCTIVGNMEIVQNQLKINSITEQFAQEMISLTNSKNGSAETSLLLHEIV